ncbi:MAG: chromosomal replication initiator protein DnaA [Parcubacteria group bacterium]|nr:chromosomal replication initiator protein DnaA [Parcubacteria group bacterium]
MNSKDLWKAALGEIQLNISKANFLTWFKDTFIIEQKGDTVSLGVPSNFAKDWLNNKYHKTILQALNHLDPNIVKVEYIVTEGNSALEKIKKARSSRKKIKEEPILEQQLNFQELTIDPETNLNPRYTFETFIVGSNNELAHAAALAVTENLGSKYNPLFIYGGVGLGKTHLLQAIGNKVKKENKKLKIKYASSEKFIDELVKAIGKQNMDTFKAAFRNVDLLLIDDVQFIAGKDKTQEELFHTFNNLYEKNKQIVFTSDRPPKAIPSIEERLRSRFEGGMIADIGYPDFETRLAILQAKVQAAHVNIDDKILRYIAEVIPKNIRELEGALNRVIARSRLQDTPLTLEESKKILTAIINNMHQFIPLKDVLNKVASFYDLSQEELINHSRKKELVKPRQVAMYLLREELKYSYTNIAEKLGHRDHTTVIHACKKIEMEINKNPIFNQEITLIKEMLYNQ